jgi:hypothetical protein
MTAKESPAVKAADSVTEAPAAIVEEPAKSAQKELDKTMPGVEKPPFDVENAKASAVTGEWAKLQEAVAEAVKEVDKPKTKDAEAPKTPDAAIKAEADVSMTDAPKAEAKEPEAKAEPKEKKTGKSKLDDIEIVEDESFWKDI